MTIRLNPLFAGAAMLAAIGATAASAVTIVTAVPGGPFSVVNPLATLPGTQLYKLNTYDFTFTMAQPLNGSVSSIQIQAQAERSGDNEPITFDLYSGDSGSGTFVATSSTGANANLMFNAAPGDYYVEVTPAYIKQGVSGEALSGTILTGAVPEPATWAMMLVGLGGLGAISRRGRALSAARV